MQHAAVESGENKDGCDIECIPSTQMKITTHEVS